jgi:hypothetical protein
MERDTVNYLSACLNDEDIVRRQRTGKDRGDVHGVKLFGNRMVLEVKSTAKMNLPAWVREAEVERGNDDALVGVVVHKRHGNAKPADQWVSMTLGELVTILTLNRDHYDDS